MSNGGGTYGRCYPEQRRGLRSRVIWFASATREHTSVDLQPRLLRVSRGGVVPNDFGCIKIALKISDHPSQKHGVEPTWPNPEHFVEDSRRLRMMALFGERPAERQPNVIELRPQLQRSPILLDGPAQ